MKRNGATACFNLRTSPFKLPDASSIAFCFPKLHHNQQPNTFDCRRGVHGNEPKGFAGSNPVPSAEEQNGRVLCTNTSSSVQNKSRDVCSDRLRVICRTPSHNGHPDCRNGVHESSIPSGASFSSLKRLKTTRRRGSLGATSEPNFVGTFNFVANGISGCDCPSRCVTCDM